MSDSIPLENMYDVMKTTLAKYKKPSWLDISRRRQKWPFALQILKARQQRETGGSSHKWFVKVDKQSNAKHVGAYAVVKTAVKDFNVEAESPLRASMTSFAWDTMAEEETQKSAERVVDVIQQRRVDAYSDLVELIEDTGWGCVTDPTDKETPWGLFQTILPHPLLATANGFVAQNTPGGWTQKQGISGTSHNMWNNYSFGYTDVSNNEHGFVYEVFDALELTQFQAPWPFPNLSPETADWGMYSTRVLRKELNQYLENRNDNYGQDLAAFHGDPVIRQNPVQWVPALDTLSINGTAITDPFVAINWSVMDVVCSGEWDWKEIVTKPSDQPTVIRPTIWKKWNIANLDPSRHVFGNRFSAAA